MSQYGEMIAALRSSPYLNFPKHVHIETAAICNAKCWFCPQDELPRHGTTMPDALVEKIINDLTDIPRNVQFQLSPFKVNEPFLDNRIIDIIATCNEKLPNAAITVITNSSPLTERKFKQFLALKNIRYLSVSLNECTRERYEEVMKISFGRTLERLRMIHRAKENGQLAAPVIISRVGRGEQEGEVFRRWVLTEFPLFQVEVYAPAEWLGQVGIPPPATVPNEGCSRWFELSITATGAVAHCCMDGLPTYPIGDVKTQHVLQVYNAPAYRKLRESTLSRIGVTPCGQCSFG